MPTGASHSAKRRQVLIALNPGAGARSGKRLVEQVAHGLKERGYEVAVISDIPQLIEEVQTAHRAGTLCAAAAAGGDGTAALLVNVLPPGSPLALIPLGTENLLAKYLGVTPDSESICETISAGVVMQLDAGQANGRLFLLMLGCGFDAEVVRRLHQERKGHIHHFSYAKPILDSIRSYEYPELRVCCEAAGGGTQTLTGCWAFIVNLPRYAGGLKLIPGADGADGLLDVCTFRRGNLWNGLTYLGGVWLGQHGSWRDFETARSPRIRIESEAEDVPYQLDGDPGGVLPVEVEVLPGRITVMAPPAWRVAQGIPASP
jgi:diacylglycerol kinase family enzyme